MVVVVNLGTTLTNAEHGLKEFLQYFITELASQHPDVQFHLVSLIHTSFKDEVAYYSNIHFISQPLPPGSFLYRLRSAAFIRQTVQQLKADIYIGVDGRIYKGLEAKQYLLVRKGQVNQLKPGSASTIKGLITFSEAVKKEIGSRTNNIKTIALHSAPRLLEAPANDDGFIIKERYTDGKEYFIYKGVLSPEANIVPLLKAFSLFKKRQKTDMKLVLSGVKNWDRDEFQLLINTYKYKEDVVIPQGLYEWEEQGLLGSAYAFVLPNAMELANIAALDAMQSGIPVLACHKNSLIEIAPGEALYFNEDDINDMADKLMYIYKDEGYRSQLIKKGSTLVKDLSWQKTAEAFWSFIEP